MLAKCPRYVKSDSPQIVSVMGEKRIEEFRPGEEIDEPRWLSRISMRQLLTRNAACQIALDKFTRQLDRERKITEINFRIQKQKLLLQQSEAQRTDITYNSKPFCGHKHAPEVLDFNSQMPGRLRDGSRGSCRPERSRLELNQTFSRWENRWRDTIDADSVPSRSGVVSTTTQSGIRMGRKGYKSRDDGVQTPLTKQMSDRVSSNEVKLVRPMSLSHIVSSIVLPPTYQSYTTTQIAKFQRSEMGEVFGREGTGIGSATPVARRNAHIFRQRKIRDKFLA